MNSVQAAAAWFALLPMAAGLSVLGLFVLTDNDVFPVLGLLLLWIGFTMTVAASVLAVVGHRRAARDGMPRVDRWRITACLLALICAAYPVAAVCMVGGVMWATRGFQPEQGESR